jgi:hypothetical protein
LAGRWFNVAVEEPVWSATDDEEIAADGAVVTGARRRSTRGLCLMVLALVLASGDAAAQFGNLCQTAAGACLANPSPLGSSCLCHTQSGIMHGTILGGAQGMASPLCRTSRSVCQIPGVAPVGTPCNCYGDPGAIVPP